MISPKKGGVSLYLSAPTGEDPRTILAALSGEETEVHLLSAAGSPPDPDLFGRLGRALRFAHLRALPSHREELRTRLGTSGFGFHPLPAADEVRLRLLSGRCRKENPYAEAPPEPPLPDDLDALLDGVVEDIDRPDAPPPPVSDLPDIKETMGRLERLVQSAETGPDDLDVLFGRIDWTDPDRVFAEPGSSGDDLDHDLGLDQIDDPEPVISDPGASPTPPPAPEEGTEADGAVTLPEEELNVYPVLERRRAGLLRHLLDSFSDPRRFDRALSGVQAELQERARDPDRFFRPGREELWGARLGRDILHEDRYVCVAWTDQVEGRLRLRLVRFSDAKDLRPHHERGMRLLMDRIARYERGPVEAILPPSLRVSPELMRAGGFVHQMDLPRWVWGEDCALWVRPPAAG